MREYLDRVMKADQCAQYVDHIGVAAIDARQLIANLRATLQCIREAGLKLSMHKATLGALKSTSLEEQIPLKGSNLKIKELLISYKKTKLLKSKKALQRYLGFLNYYRKYIPRNYFHSSNSSKKTKRSWWQQN